MYDEGNTKFKFAALHMPYYYDTAIATNYFNAGTPNKMILVNKEGGIAFTDLQPKSLWFDKLGFDTDIIINETHRTLPQTPGGSKVNWIVPVISNRQDGTNSTGAYTGLDTCINKTGAQSGNPVVVPTLGGGNPVGFSSSNTTACYAKIPLVGGKLDEPYFLVEVNINAPQNYVGQGVKRDSIKGIVGKFFSINSYTNGGADSGVSPYIHQGDPFVLSDIKIRILDPNFQMAEGIGDNNAVFLEIIKAQKPPKQKNNDKLI